MVKGANKWDLFDEIFKRLRLIDWMQNLRNIWKINEMLESHSLGKLLIALLRIVVDGRIQNRIGAT